MISGILHTTLNKINEAARKLQADDINIEFEEDWSKRQESSGTVYSNDPYIGRGNYNGTEGFYFNRNDLNNFDEWEEGCIKLVMEEYGFEVVHITICEYDDDRNYRATIGFKIKK